LEFPRLANAGQRFLGGFERAGLIFAAGDCADHSQFSVFFAKHGKTWGGFRL
jgi:hypothetical protein